MTVSCIFGAKFFFLTKIFIFDWDFDWPNFARYLQGKLIKILIFPLSLEFYQKFDFWPIFRFWSIFRFLIDISNFGKTFWTKFQFLTKILIFDQDFYLWSNFRLFSNLSKVLFLTNISIFVQKDFWLKTWPIRELSTTVGSKYFRTRPVLNI